MKKISVFIIIFIISAMICLSENYTAEPSADFFNEFRNEKSVLKSMEKVLENDMLEFYIKNDEDIMALVNKKNGFIWWSSPINADTDTTATDALKYELKSSLCISYHTKKDSKSINLKSAKDSEISYSINNNSVIITYKFTSAGITVPVNYSLGEDYLEVSVFADDISENSSKLIHSIDIMNSFGAGGIDDNGYFIIPDGCGAVIDFNNGKINAKTYSAMVYGEDITAVKDTYKDTDIQQVNMPVYCIVRDKNGILAVADDGDENLMINADVSIQSKTDYNKCRFSFITRESDSYYIGNEENPITVYQNDDISNRDMKIRYYPLADNDGISYCSMAEKYRDYLINEKGLECHDFSEVSDLFIDLYGGTLKKKSFLGIPIYRKTAVTSYSQAADIINNIGLENISVTYRNWNNQTIAHKVDYSANPSDILGGKDDFSSLLNTLQNKNCKLYPVSENITFSSGNGYGIFFNTALRISGSYARIPTYDYAYGIENKFRKNYSVISPSCLDDIYSRISDNYISSGLDNISLGKSLSVLYGDYGKKNISRGDMLDIMKNNLEEMHEEFSSVLAEYPAAYALPYVDCITDIPLKSSGYDIFDYDIPFWQMVIHGVIPYSSTPLNSSPNPKQDTIKAVAYGNALNYDIIGGDIYEISDTDADTYFYAKFNYIKSDYDKYADIIRSIKGAYISGYELKEDGFLIHYSNGVSIYADDENITLK
ncbi:MAG: DUF5696 domain-containing protein [Oscillospiraceae bacterium]